MLLYFGVLFFTLSLTGCNAGGDDEDAFDAYDMDPTTADSLQKCTENSDDSLPRWVQFSDDGRRLVAGLGTQDEFYRFSTDDNSDVKRIDLQFTQEDWWTRMENNYASETELSASMSYNGEELESPVGVRFKGFTSYQWNNTEKKSFNISLDYLDKDQNISGYDTLNLNCAWGDDTFMREVIYEHINRRYIPAVSVNYVELYINGEYWGIYINSQQLDNNFIKEWFTSTNGTRWRAAVMGGITNDGGLTDDFPFPGDGELPDDFPLPGDGELPDDFPLPGEGGRGDFTPDDGELPDDLPFPGGGGGFGGGVSAFDYLGNSAEDYTAAYNLLKYCWSDPWDDLINVCYALEYTQTDEMENEISKYLDLDRTLWFLVMENIFADEDGYINKGAMDYYIYWDDATGLVVPLEFDGNSTLLASLEMGGGMPGNGQLPGDEMLPGPGGMGSLLEWTPFNNADNSNRPLLYKLLNVPSIRQRYLAHMRTVLNESFNEANMGPMIDAYASKIESYITTDPKTFITDFPTAVQELKDAVATRCSTLWSNEELNVVGLAISDVKWLVGSEEYATPSSSDDLQEVTITATVQDLENGGGVNSVYTYIADGIDGTFTKMQMNSAGNDVYTITLAEKASGVRTRFYIEAVAGDDAGTRTYYPSGTASDVFTFQVDGE